MNYQSLNYQKNLKPETESLWSLAVAAALLTLVLFKMSSGGPLISDPVDDTRPEISAPASTQVLG